MDLPTCFIYLLLSISSSFAVAQNGVDRLFVGNKQPVPSHFHYNRSVFNINPLYGRPQLPPSNQNLPNMFRLNVAANNRENVYQRSLQNSLNRSYQNQSDFTKTIANNDNRYPINASQGQEDSFLVQPLKNNVMNITSMTTELNAEETTSEKMHDVSPDTNISSIIDENNHVTTTLNNTLLEKSAFNEITSTQIPISDTTAHEPTVIETTAGENIVKMDQTDITNDESSSHSSTTEAYIDSTTEIGMTPEIASLTSDAVPNGNRLVPETLRHFEALSEEHERILPSILEKKLEHHKPKVVQVSPNEISIKFNNLAKLQLNLDYGTSTDKKDHDKGKRPWYPGSFLPNIGLRKSGTGNHIGMAHRQLSRIMPGEVYKNVKNPMEYYGNKICLLGPCGSQPKVSPLDHILKRVKVLYI